MRRHFVTFLRLGIVVVLLAGIFVQPESALASTVYVLDNFSTATYNNQSGTTNWSTNWIETNDDNSATTGEVLITGGALRINNNADGDLESIEREINMPVNSTATLSFNLTDANLEVGDILILEVYNGVTWTTLQTYNGNTADGIQTFDITNYRSSNTRIRFRVSAGFTVADEFFNADNVRVDYWSASTHTPSSVFQTVQTYYVPVPENQGLLMLDTINAAAADPMYRYVSITIDADDTVIYYDHWEDDFEAKTTDPQQNTSEVWGDNNTANGIAPGYTTDVFAAGDIIILDNTVASTNLNLIDFDGGDKISSTNAIAVTSTSWPSGAGTLHGGSIEMLDTSLWGTRFDVPADSGDQANDFDYAGITIMASEDNTSIYLNSVLVATIGEGESYLFDGGVVNNANDGDIVGGNQITASAPVQANFLTGNIGSNYASSWYALYPFDLLSNDYYAPVDENNNIDVAVYLQNPNASSITVHWVTTAGAQTNQVIAAGATARVLMPAGINSGARFYTDNASDVFQAISTIDTGGQAHDWGYTLIPSNQLTQQAQVGWGVGRDPTSGTNPTEDGSPIWVVAVGTGTMNICADYDGDGVGSLTDSNGSQYDQLLSLANLARAKIYDTDGDQTGMLLYLCNGSESANSKQNKIAVAWGQEPGVASTAAPGLDVGTSVPPLPNFTAIKNAVLTNDINGDGRFDIGDTFEYQITINNVGALPIPANTITVEDIVPLYTNYVANSTEIDSVSIPDAGSGTPFPLDGGGYLIPNTLVIDGVFVITFRVTIDVSIPGNTTIQNDAYVSGLDLSYFPRVEIFVGTPNTIGDFIWLDRDGDGVQDSGEPGIPGVTVELSNGICTIGSTCPTTVTDTNGGYIFTQVSSGTYTVIVQSATLPTGVTQTGDPDATLNNQHTLTVSGGNYLIVDFGYQGDAVLSDYVWLDADADGVQDASETGISGVTIWVDLDNDGVRNLDEPFATTDSNGLYSIDGLYAGTYVVRADISSLSNVTPTYDLNGVGTPNVVTGVTLASGQTRTDVDWGYWSSTTATTAIGNTIWLDEDGNGYQDAGEVGIPNVTIELWDSGHTTLLASTVTDANGNYVFKNISAGTYQVDVLDSSLPSGLVQTTVIGGTSDSTNKADPYTLTVVAGVENMTADFGYNWAPPSDTDNNTGTGSIGDRIWIDNGNGIQEPGEPGLYNVSVQLLTPGPDGILETGDDVVAATTTTGYDGSYIFDGLAAGAYAVRVNGGAAPVNYTQTGDPDQFGAACTTCDGRTTTPIVLAPGDVFVNADFGYTPTAGNGYNIGDTLWLDSDRAGDVDAGELRLAGVTVALIRDLDGDGIWDAGEPIIATDITDATGVYTFTNLPVTDGTGTDDYLVWANDTENVLSGLVPVYDSNGTGTPNISAVTNMTAANNLAQDFGYAPVGHDTGEGLIGDTIYYDRDAGSDYDLGESLEGVRVNLYLDVNNDNVWDAGDTLLASTYTNENGQYFFGGLAAGEYVVRVDTATLPAGVTNTVDPDGGIASEAAETLTAGEINLTRDFGYRDTSTPNTISGTLWRDTDADGLLDAGETARFQNSTVVLRDSNGNIVATTATDASGNYSFGNLPDGTYRVDVTDDANLLDGYWHSLGASAGSDNNSQTDTYTVTVAGGQTNTTADFGYYRYPASIGDFVWDDTDGDGIQDVGELGISGATVTLTITWLGGAGTTTLTTTTAANGSYSFGNLLLDEDFDGAGAGEPTFTVTFTTPSNYLPSPADQGGDDGLDSDGLTEPASPVEGGAITNIDSGFIEQVVNIGDTLWYDWDGDGTQDANEPGIPNIDVFVDINNNGIYDAGTDLLDVTDASGQYSFLDLALGTYRVIVNTSDPQFPTGVTQTADPDVSFDNEHTVNGTTAGTYNNVDFGYQGTGSISNYVWNDIDGDGVQDVSESGISGVTVWVDLDNDGVLDATEPSSVTDTNGQYYIGGLYANAGGYVVRVNAGAGSPVNGATATYDVDGGAVPASTANIATVTLSAGQNRTDVDWGYQIPALSITKASDAGGTVSPGDTIQYTITVRNNTASTHTGIAVTDALPTGTTYVAQSTTVDGYTVVPAIVDTFPTNGDANTGTGWTGAWQEYNEADGFAAGDEQVIGNALRIQDNDSGGEGAYREANLSGMTSAWLTLTYASTGIDNANEDSVIQASTDGTTWTTVYTWDGALGNTAGSLAIDITSYIDTDTRIRFVTSTNFENGDNILIDNIRIGELAAEDAFPTAGDGNTGTGWAAAWIEAGETTNYSADQIQILAGELRFQGTNGPNSIEREVDLSGASNATLVYDCRASLNHENTDTVVLAASSNGGSSWTNLGTITLDTINNANCAAAFESFDISSYLAANTRIRFTHTASAADENFYVDNIRILYTQAPTAVTKDNIPAGANVDLTSGVPSTLVVAGDNFGLTPNQEMTVTYSVTVNNPVPGGLTSIDNTASVVSTQQPTAQQASVSDLLPNASIGDRVWLDENSDGVQDAGESGIPNVRVFLDTDNDGAYDVGETYVYTDTEGNYIFTGASPATYNVAVDTTTLPSGLSNATYDEDNGTTSPNSRTSVTLTAEQEYVTADFGYNWATTTDITNPGGIATGAIGDRVWIDADGDGVQDPGEAGLSGVTVNLITAGTDGLFGTADDVTAASTSTNAAGSYIFDGLSAGAYVVQVSAPVGYTQTGDPDSTLDNQTITPILLAPGDVYVNADFGYQLNSGANTIGNQIFVDTNGDGNLDGGEPGIPGVTVALLNNSGAVIATTLTDASGGYSFPGLPDGTYTVWVNDTANVLGALAQNSTPNNAVDGGQPCGTCNGQNTVTVSGGAGNANQDFGFAPSGHGSGEGLIGDTIFLDRDGGNDYDFGEGLEGVTVRLYIDTNADGNYDAGEPLVAATITNENGQYYFGNLPAGNYVVQVDTTTLPAGVTNTVDVGDATLNEGGTNLTAGELELGMDFGYQDTSSPNSISGTLWDDTDADGSLEGGETDRFENVTVVLRDSNGNIVATTTTDSSGNYSFTNLPDDTYTVDVTDGNNILDGYWHSTGGSPGSDNNSQSDPYSVTVSGGQNNTTADFGYYRDPSTVGNQVWLDRDNDGVKDADEPGLPGVTVTLTVTYPNGNVTTLNTTTDDDGLYSFGNLLLDENHDGAGGSEPVYAISVSAPAGTTASPENAAGTNDEIDNDSDGTSENATLTKGETDPSYDFGFYASRLDLGDLPDVYRTLFSPGPAHVLFTDTNADNMPEITSGIPAAWLGNIVDAELNGVPGASASGDDAATVDDEDGLVLAASGWTAGNSSTATVTINSDQSGVTVYYGYWIDWDNNGTLETFYNGSAVSGSPTSTDISVAVPGSYVADTPVYMRVRSDDQPFTIADFEGTRFNGEVEDYWFQFDSGGTTTPITLSYFKAQRSGRNITFNWSTATETGNVGFNLYVQDKDGLHQINAELIPSKVIDSLEQQDYSFNASLTGVIFYIEDISIVGEAEMHGPFRLGKAYGERLLANKIDQSAINAEHEAKEEERQDELEEQIQVPDAARESDDDNKSNVKVTKTPKPTKTPKITKTPKPTKTPKVTKTPKPTRTPKPTKTPLVTPTETPIPTTETPEETPTPDVTEEPTETPEETPTPDVTEEPTETPEETPTPEATEEPTETPEETPTPVETPTEQPTETPEPTPAPQYAVPVPVDPSALQLTTTLNLKVNKTGLHRVTYEMLKDSGLDLLDVPASKLTLINRDMMIPVYVYSPNEDGTFGPGGYIEFYGEALDTLYTDTNIYTVQVSDAPASIIPLMDSAPDLQLQSPVSYTETLKVNNQRKYASYAPGDDPWYDTGMLTYTTPRSWNFSFAVNELVDAPATLELGIWGAMTWPQAPDHHILVSVNGTPVKDYTFDGLTEQTVTMNLPAGLLQEGANTMQLTLPGDLGVQYDMIALDKYAVAYQRNFRAQGNGLTFTAMGDAFTVTNLPSANITVYRMRNNGLARLADVTVQLDGSTFTASFAGTDQADTYLVAVEEGLNAPSLEATRLTADLNLPAQYLIISHPDFIDGLQPLIRYHQSRGLTVNVVDVNDLYTHYTDGIFDPKAISDHIRFAAANLGTEYVLLVGGDTYDYRNYTGKNSISFIPSLYVATSPTIRHAPVDPLYADLNGDNIPDLPIGRFPVRTTAELQMMVSKTLAYAGNTYERTAVFAADKIDGGLSFKNINAGMVSTLPAGWSVNSINLDDMEIAIARQQLLAALNKGTSMATFTGHSSATAWSFSNLLTVNDLSSLNNAGRPFVAVQWGCWNTYYVDPVNNNLVQAMLFSGDRGAAASLGAVSLTQAESERLLGNLLTPRMVTPGKPIGQALQEAKSELAQTHPELLDVLLGWTLMGDPALAIK